MNLPPHSFFKLTGSSLDVRAEFQPISLNSTSCAEAPSTESTVLGGDGTSNPPEFSSKTLSISVNRMSQLLTNHEQWWYFLPWLQKIIYFQLFSYIVCPPEPKSFRSAQNMLINAPWISPNYHPPSTFTSLVDWLVQKNILSVQNLCWILQQCHAKKCKSKGCSEGNRSESDSKEWLFNFLFFWSVDAQFFFKSSSPFKLSSVGQRRT